VAKKVIKVIKLQIPAGQANPAPPVGPALGQHGVNIMDFCKAFNAATQGPNAGQMRTDTSAGLVGAGMVSVLVYPVVAGIVRTARL